MGVTQPQSGAWRIPFVRRCRLEAETGVCEAVSFNISTKGVYVAVDPVPGVGDRVRLLVPLREGLAPLAAEAVVAWRNTPHHPKVFQLPAGCGLRFVHVPPQAEERLMEMVQAYRRATQRRR